MWWSIAAENFNPMLRTWTCPWCGHKHKPPHRDTVEEIRREKNDYQLKHEEKIFGK